MSSWTTVPLLAGRHARLEPLRRVHAQGLAAAAADGALWELWYTSVPRTEGIADWIEAALAAQAQGRALPFAVFDASGAIVGSTRFYDLDPEVPRVQIGYTWYARTAQRTALNTQAKLLLLGHAFDTLGCISVGFETSAENAASRAAIARLGARQEGILRNHRRHADGSVRDTVAFSITDGEWPGVRQRLQERLAAGAGDGLA